MQKSGTSIYRTIALVFIAAVWCTSGSLRAQVTPSDSNEVQKNPGVIVIDTDSTKSGGKAGGKSGGGGNDTPVQTSQPQPLGKDNAPVVTPKPKYDYKYHSPVKATWMSAALPGLGQFYNRRYWKPPIIYAGLGVSIYFLIDNQLKFITARNSYRARLGVPGYTVADKYLGNDATQIESDRDYYRTTRDYCIIAVAGIYALNIIDAVVDAHLRSFDVGDDLSMKVRPSFQLTGNGYQNGFAPTTGIAWTLKF